ncbi:phage tail tape measure protein [Bradyrhizobium nanningense]|uniref:phage tail tape measure protein n=1 Tax=Bradyrhizobium TaxID=374 RepID=UPI003D30FFF3
MAAGVDVKGNLLRSGPAAGNVLTNAQAGSFYDAVGLKSPSAGNGVDPAVLKQQIGLEQQRIGILGGMASISDVIRQKELEIATARLNHINITDREADALKALARENALGITAMKQQADTTRIQAETLGMSAGAAAEYTAVQTRLAGALRNKQGLTAQDIAAIKAQAAALGQVTLAAAIAAVNDNVGFGQQTALLSPDDVQIAQQLRGIYPDVATALGSVEAGAAHQCSPQRALLDGLRPAGDRDDRYRRWHEVDRAGLPGYVEARHSRDRRDDREDRHHPADDAGPPYWGNSLGLSSGVASIFGGGGGLPGTAGSAFYGPVAPSALGNIFAGGNIIPFARGGVVSIPTLFPMANGGTGLMGEAGPEAVMPLRRGADGRLGVSAGGAANDNRSSGGVVVNVINQTGVQAEASTSRNANGDVTVTLKKMMDDSVGQSLSSGAGSRVLKNQYGVRQFMGS